ncbi:MAG: hypothetical protein KatS3mg101_1147 [Patescibacteria group bacterium]|nr:MAG: hypothetical protein KatS3mg101_1147 [Patescibacteria group bacterium]
MAIVMVLLGIYYYYRRINALDNTENSPLDSFV